MSLFTKIITGEIPSYKIAENDHYLAFLDINPNAKGHTLVIPKEHSRWIWDIKDSYYLEYMTAVKTIAEILKDYFDTDCVQEIIAGFGIAHTHVHLIPRKENDGLDEIPTKVLEPKPTMKELTELAKKIQNK